MNGCSDKQQPRTETSAAMTRREIEDARGHLKAWFPNQSVERHTFNKLCDQAVRSLAVSHVAPPIDLSIATAMGQRSSIEPRIENPSRLVGRLRAACFPLNDQKLIRESALCIEHLARELDAERAAPLSATAPINDKVQAHEEITDQESAQDHSKGATNIGSRPEGFPNLPQRQESQPPQEVIAAPRQQPSFIRDLGLKPSGTWTRHEIERLWTIANGLQERHDAEPSNLGKG